MQEPPPAPDPQTADAAFEIFVDVMTSDPGKEPDPGNLNPAINAAVSEAVAAVLTGNPLPGWVVERLSENPEALPAVAALATEGRRRSGVPDEPDMTPDDVGRARLMTAETLRCEFEGFGAESIIDAIDYDAGRARHVGALGAEPMLAFRGDNGMNFIEVTGSGNMTTTTVFAWWTSRARGLYAAVTSRHHAG